MEKEFGIIMDDNATLLFTDDDNRGKEIKLPSSVGFELLKLVQGVLTWTTTSENCVNVHKIYLEFDEGEDKVFYPSDFVYEIKTYDGNIEAMSEKRFDYDGDLCFETLKTWADKKIEALSGEVWTPARVKWLKKHYNMAPEDLEEIYGDDLPDFLEELFNKDLYMQWSPGKVKWLKKHYNMTPEEAEALGDEELSHMVDELFKLEADNYDKPEGNLIANIADILNQLGDEDDAEEGDTMIKGRRDNMEHNATLLLTDWHNRGTEIHLSPKIGFELLKCIQGELEWMTEPKEVVIRHRIYIQFEDDDKYALVHAPYFIYEMKTYHGKIYEILEKRFQYCEDMRFATLKAWADEEISKICNSLDNKQ